MAQLCPKDPVKGPETTAWEPRRHSCIRESVKSFVPLQQAGTIFSIMTGNKSVRIDKYWHLVVWHQGSRMDSLFNCPRSPRPFWPPTATGWQLVSVNWLIGNLFDKTRHLKERNSEWLLLFFPDLEGPSCSSQNSFNAFIIWIVLLKWNRAGIHSLVYCLEIMSR